MNRVYQHRIRSGLLAGTVVIAMGLIGGAAAAQAAPCTTGPGVTQSSTTVTGSNGNDTITCPAGTTVTTINGNGGNDTITSSNGLDSTINGGDGNDTITSGAGNDTINGGLGIDTISGSAGNDNLVGPSNDGSQDSLDGGDGTDTCQGPPPDGDIHASCERTAAPPASGPGSSTQTATDLCRASGGRIVLATLPVQYSCVFLTLGNHRLPEASRICTGRGGRFIATPLTYTCLLPGTQAVLTS
jgi:Ca2+-binding RTX toxin-like protein